MSKMLCRACPGAMRSALDLPKNVCKFIALIYMKSFGL